MDLENKITEELKLAMKSKDKLVLTALRAIKSELMIAKTNAGQKKVINNEIELKILQKLVKQRKESSKIYLKKGRNELAETELKEAEIIQRFLPKQLTNDEIEFEVKNQIKNINAKGLKDMGAVMSAVTKKLAGAADGKTISEIVRKHLS
ncbi:MAG: glutamyl-tRNA amidotransferase [Flavobacteriaceae bacterium]|nr:glutamyl-tRNA amidotransferase [Flavobacteriaceae bacterium]